MEANAIKSVVPLSTSQQPEIVIYKIDVGLDNFFSESIKTSNS